MSFAVLVTATPTICPLELIEHASIRSNGELAGISVFQVAHRAVLPQEPRVD